MTMPAMMPGCFVSYTYPAGSFGTVIHPLLAFALKSPTDRKIPRTIKKSSSLLGGLPSMAELLLLMAGI